MSRIPSPTVAADPAFFVTLLHAVRDALARDADLIAWCLANSARQQTVMVGIDDRDPPAASQYPLLHVYPLRESGGLAAEEEGYLIGVSAGLYNENGLEPVYAGVAELEAVALLPELARLVVAAAGAVEAGGCYLAHATIEYETVEFFPYFFAGLEMRFQRPAEFRQRF